MSKRDKILLLEDMLNSALKIKQYTENIDFNAFLADDKTIDAVIRNFEIMWSIIETYLDELIDRLDTIISKNKAT